MELSQTPVTIYQDVYSKKPHHIALHHIIHRIRTGGKCMQKIQSVRAGDAAAKKQLAAIVFSGVVEGAREDANLKQHSNLVILDFDKLGNRLPEVRAQMKARADVVAAFTSPSGDGLKVVLHIASGAQHRQHYKALMREIDGLDEKNINETRACFESYDPEIYVNYNAKPYTTTAPLPSPQKGETKNTPNNLQHSNKDGLIKPPLSGEVGRGPGPLQKLEQWLVKKGNVFASGNRNYFIFCLAGSACRFGIAEEEVTTHVRNNYLTHDNTFTEREALSAVRSAYKRNVFGSAELREDILIERETLKEVEILSDDLPIKDVIYGADVWDEAKRLYEFGYESADPTGIAQIDKIFKWKRGELTVLTGIANHGKSSILDFLMLNKSAKDGTKWAVFSPENYPPQEYYHGLAEIVVGTGCTPENIVDRPSLEVFERAYDFVKEHFFYIYPKNLEPTPQYVKSRFVELIIKEKVGGCVIDPFNQLTNDYRGSNNRDDKYLETFLSDISRFAVTNNVFMVIVAHPSKMVKRAGQLNYDAPDAYDLAGGAMWNNKADNILVYHRPKKDEDPTSRLCHLIARKIRRQKIVGLPGTEEFEYSRGSKRFLFEDYPLKHLDIGAPPARKRLFEARVEEEEDGEPAPF